MTNPSWSGPTPSTLPPGSPAGWHPSREDPYLLFFWDGVKWSAVRRAGQEGVQQIDATIQSTSRVQVVPNAGEPAPKKHASSRTALAIVLVGVLAIGLVVVVVLGTRSSLPTQPGLLQASEAQSVYSSLVPRLDRDIANPLPHLGDLRAIATPDVLQVIFAEASCGCLQLPRFPAQSTEFSVPEEHHYPLSFLSETDETLYQRSTNQHFPYAFVDVFEKLTPSSPW